MREAEITLHPRRAKEGVKLTATFCLPEIGLLPHFCTGLACTGLVCTGLHWPA